MEGRTFAPAVLAVYPSDAGHAGTIAFSCAAAATITFPPQYTRPAAAPDDHPHNAAASCPLEGQEFPQAVFMNFCYSSLIEAVLAIEIQFEINVPD
jgi:hypothetical protein